MRILKVSLAIALMLVLSAGVSQAAFDNSHHDMRAYNAKTEGCVQCHGIIDASVPTSVNDNSVGKIGALCMARCHIGGGGLPAGAASVRLTPTTGPGLASQTDYTTTTVGAITITYFDSSHGRSLANLRNPAWSAASSAVAALTPTWPYVSTGTLQCTSCHAVHDNKYAPFIWSPLAPTAANLTDGFCDLCHVESGRRGRIDQAPSGNHVVNVVADNTAAAARTTLTRHPRRIVIQSSYGTPNVFDVPNPAANTMTGVSADARAWMSGGHVITPASYAAQTSTAIGTWTGAGSTQVVGCFTCHAAHRTSPGGENNLTVIANMNTGPTFNPLCVGCHGATTTYALDAAAEDVGTTAFGHPVGNDTNGTVLTATTGSYTSSVGAFTFAVTTAPGFTYVENGNQMGSAGRVLCTSCHKVHGGNRMALANLGQAVDSTGICKRCHNGVGIPNLNDVSKGSAVVTGSNALNSHHVTAAAHTWSLPGAVAQTGESANDTLYIQNPSWGTTGGMGDISATMDCADCHIFNYTAHNW